MRRWLDFAKIWGDDTGLPCQNSPTADAFEQAVDNLLAIGAGQELLGTRE
jgi:hypothetical protein